MTSQFLDSELGKQRLAYLVRLDDSRASWRLVEDLATVFGQHYHIVVIVIKPRHVVFDFTKSLPFRVIVIEGLSGLKIWQSVKDIVETQRINIIHSLGFESDGMAARTLGCGEWRWINTVLPGQKNQSWWFSLINKLPRRIRGWSVFLSETDRERRANRIERRRSTVIVPVPRKTENSIDDQTQTLPIKDLFDVLILTPPGGTVGLDLALRVLALTRVACPKIKSRVIAATQIRSRFLSLIDDCKLEGRVECVDEAALFESLKNCCVVLKLAAEFSFDQRLVMAMQLGKPLILARGDFFLSLLPPTECVRIVDNDDTYRASLTLKDILTQNDSYACLADLARSMGHKVFSFEDMIKKHQVLYRM